MAATEQVLRGIDLFERGLQGQEALSEALENLSDVFRADCVSLEAVDTQSGQLLMMEQARINPDSIPNYIANYHTTSPRTLYGKKPNAKLVSHDGDILTEREMDRDPFYADFLRGEGLRYFLGFTLSPDPRTHAFLTFQFRPSHGIIHIDDLRLGEAMRPLLFRAMARYWRERVSGDRDRVIQDLCQRFTLTMAEARMACALIDGVSVSEYAERTAISRNTAYTHYARLKEKLGRRRQVDVVAKLHALYPGAKSWG